MTLAYVTSAADVATHAAQSTETISDPAWITFWDSALNASTPSATLVSNSLSVSLPEVTSDPLGPNTTGTPRAVETFMWGPMAPAARAALVELVGVLKPIVHERGGTINVRLSLVGGPAGAGVALSIGSPSMAAWGASRQASAENAALVAAVQKAGAVTGPPISNSLLSEIVM
jgi:hypothetical protein